MTFSHAAEEKEMSIQPFSLIKYSVFFKECRRGGGRRSEGACDQPKHFCGEDLCSQIFRFIESVFSNYF